MSATSETIAKQEGCTEEEAALALMASGGNPVEARKRIRDVKDAEFRARVVVAQLATAGPYSPAHVDELLRRVGGNMEVARICLDAAVKLNVDPLAIAPVPYAHGGSDGMVRGTSTRRIGAMSVMRWWKWSATWARRLLRSVQTA